MNVIQVINVRWFNATAWYALYLARLLQDAGHTVLVVALRDTPPFAKAQEWGLSTVHLDLNSNNPLALGATLVDMIRIVRQFEPDVVNCHRGEGFFLWGLLTKLGAGFKLVRTRGDQRLPSSDFLNRWLHRNVAEAVVVTNKRMAEHFLGTMRTPEPQVWLIHGGVDTDVFQFDAQGREQVRKEFGFADNDVVIGLLGRFDEVKGQRELAHAVSRLRTERGIHNIKLFYIGFETSTKLTEVKAWITEEGIDDITAISGKRQDVAACISALDLGVVASLWSEAIARAALEIMACKRPLISSNVNVMPDLVPPEGIYPVDKEEALLNLLERAVTDADYRVQLLEAHGRTMSQLKGSDFVRRTLNLYTGLLEEHLD